MRILWCLVIGVFLVNEPAFAQARFPFTAAATADRVNVRAGQHNNYESVAVLKKGDLVTVLGKQYSWFRVALPAGSRAFLKAEYVKVLSPELGEVAVEKLNVRSAPQAEATAVGQVKQGQKFFIRETQAGWIGVQTPLAGVSGWVQESFLVFKSDGALKAVDPDDVAARKEAEIKVRLEKESVKTALLKKNADGSLSCSGMLFKRESVVAPYQVGREGRIVCFVDGPAAVLDSFAGSAVTVSGTVKAIPAEAEAAVLALTKIKFDL